MFGNAAVTVSNAPESLAILSARRGDQAFVVAAGSDARGLAYALTELADQVRYSGDPVGALID